MDDCEKLGKKGSSGSSSIWLCLATYAQNYPLVMLENEMEWIQCVILIC